MALALRPAADGTGDLLIPTQGALGASLHFGVTLPEYFAQLLHTAASPTGGRESGLHFTDLTRGLLAPVHPEAGMVEVAAGVGLALNREDRTPSRVVTLFTGDGASASGSWHEGLNFAAVRRVPLLLVVERGVDAGAGTGRATRVESFLAKAPGYGVEGLSVPGDDPERILAAARTLVEVARGGGGVQLLEVTETGGDPDPLLRYRERLLAEGRVGVAELEERERHIAGEVESALEEAERSPSSQGEGVARGVWSTLESPSPWYRTGGRPGGRGERAGSVMGAGGEDR